MFSDPTGSEMPVLYMKYRMIQEPARKYSTLFPVQLADRHWLSKVYGAIRVRKENMIIINNVTKKNCRLRFDNFVGDHQMHINKMLFLTLVSSGIIGCTSPVPVAQNFPRSYQKVAHTSQHWNIVARDVVEQTEKMVAESKGLQGREFYVPIGKRNSFFDSTFREFLIDHMVNKGMPVAVCPQADLPSGFQQAPEVNVRYETRVVRHSEMPIFQPGVLTALATGVYAIHGISKLDDGDMRAIGGIGVAAAVDTWAATMPRETKTELIITATIEERNRFMMRRSLIYYVPDGDIELFTERKLVENSCTSISDLALSSGEKPQLKEDRNTEMNRLRREAVDKDMRRFNQDYKSSVVRAIY